MKLYIYIYISPNYKLLGPIKFGSFLTSFVFRVNAEFLSGQPGLEPCRASEKKGQSPILQLPGVQEHIGTFLQESYVASGLSFGEELGYQGRLPRRGRRVLSRVLGKS